MNNENKKTGYIKTIERLYSNNESVANLYKRYQAVLVENGIIIGRSKLTSKKKATEFLEATQKRWDRMEKRRQENEN